MELAKLLLHTTVHNKFNNNNKRTAMLLGCEDAFTNLLVRGASIELHVV